MSTSMRVVSWNLCWRFCERWRERQGVILATLEELRPDIVGLQEVWAEEGAGQADLLADALGMHAAYGGPAMPPPPRPPESPDQVGVEVGVAVLSRWPITDARQHRLPSRDHDPTEALAVEVRHPEGPLHVVCACVEWEAALHDLHVAQTRALAEVVSDPSLDGPLPVLLTADLNAPPGTPQIQPLLRVAMDAWAEARRADGRGHTLSSANPLAPREAWQIDARIDYVILRPGRGRPPPTVERAFLAGDPRDGLHPSDHYAVVADVRPSPGATRSES